MMAFVTLLTLSACKDDDVTPEPTATDVQQIEAPTKDALSVTTNKSYVLYGKWEDELGQALGRRLQGTMMSHFDADIYVINPSIIGQNSMGTDEWSYIVRRCLAGKASCVLTQCTFKEFYNFGVAYILAALNIVLEDYIGDTDTEAEARACMKRQMANVVRNAYMAGGHADHDTTRGTEVNGQELDWENIDKWPQEKQQAIMFDAYAFSAGNEIYVLNAEASKYMNEEVAQQPGNDYEWGQKADAIANWLNRQGKEEAEARAGLAGFSRGVTRAGGSATISDLMSAQTKEFVFDYNHPDLGNIGASPAYSALKVRYTIYSAYDFGGNVEYYQVRQNIIAMNDRIHLPANDVWYMRSNDGTYNLTRGAWMKSIDTKMWLEGAGTKTIMSAGPLNENGTSSGYSSQGGSKTITTGHTNGLSVGLSGGMSGGMASLLLNGNYTHTWTYSESDATTWETATNWSTKDLTTTYTQGNDANATATWKHTGNTPTTDEGTQTNNVKVLLKNTCITDEQVLWKVDRPTDAYTLKAHLNVVSEIVKINNYWSNGPAYVTQDNPHDISFTPNPPNRFRRKWNNVIYNYGNVPVNSQLPQYLDTYIETSYGNANGNNADNFCWATLFTSTEATADGSDNARAVFRTFKNSIQGMKLHLLAKGFSGRLVFGLKEDGVDELTDSITLNLNTIYNVGETITKNVNGYDLTFKVTKKNQEVELSSVPKDFRGELVIPSELEEGALTVTSLGNFCALGCEGITAVTIPSTVSLIGNVALAHLNITAIHVPEGVETIGEGAFISEKLVKIWLPSTLKAIQDDAFYSYFGVNNTEIHIKATTPPDLGENVFTRRYENATLYVPSGCKRAYERVWTWNHFNNIVEE